jgi:hypothetical protein
MLSNDVDGRETRKQPKRGMTMMQFGYFFFPLSCVSCEYCYWVSSLFVTAQDFVGFPLTLVGLFVGTRTPGSHFYHYHQRYRTSECHILIILKNAVITKTPIQKRQASRYPDFFWLGSLF